MSGRRQSETSLGRGWEPRRFPFLGQRFLSEDGRAGLPSAESLGPRCPLLTQGGVRESGLDAALSRVALRNSAEGHRGRRAGSGLRGTGEGGRDGGGGGIALADIYWGFCGSVCSGRKKILLPWQPNVFFTKLSPLEGE